MYIGYFTRVCTVPQHHFFPHVTSDNIKLSASPQCAIAHIALINTVIDKTFSYKHTVRNKICSGHGDFRRVTGRGYRHAFPLLLRRATLSSRDAHCSSNPYNTTRTVRSDILKT